MKTESICKPIKCPFSGSEDNIAAMRNSYGLNSSTDLQCDECGRWFPISITYEGGGVCVKPRQNVGLMTIKLSPKALERLRECQRKLKEILNSKEPESKASDRPENIVYFGSDDIDDS